MNRFMYMFRKKFFRSLENDIDYDEMTKMIRKNPEIVVIDVRTKDEFGYNHLKGAVKVPLQDLSEEKVKRYVKSKTSVVIVYCEYGGRSRKAWNKLRKMGYENVYNLEGGIENI